MVGWAPSNNRSQNKQIMHLLSFMAILFITVHFRKNVQECRTALVNSILSNVL